jgi:hypothetical protein
MAECRGLAPLARRHALVSTEARLACPVGIPEMARRSFSEGWSAWQDLHLQPSRFERDASSLGYTRLACRAVARSEGWCPRSDLHRHPARFKCAVSALDYVGFCQWPSDWCRVREFHPQPLRSERSASGSWANAAKWHSRQDSHLQPRRSKRRTLIL